MKPLISIIVPIYKVENYLDNCICSIINQLFHDFELILVDDGSPDKCPEICDSWAIKDNRVKVIHKNNGGLSDARNYGIDAAVGKYIWFVDSDDWIANDALKVIVDNIRRYPKADAFVTQIMEVIDGVEKFNGNLLEWPDNITIENNREFASRMTSVLPSVRYIVKRDVYEKNDLRFIVGVLHEDLPFCHMLMNFTKTLVVIPKVTYYYRIRSGSITTSQNINSCYSLVKTHRELKHFINDNVANTDKGWYMKLTYDYFYEIFLRIYPFRYNKKYVEFMNLYGKYIKAEFKIIIPYLQGKRKLLGYIYLISPKLYSRLIYTKRQS